MSDHDSPFDTGLQVERTLLAWRRTALALAVVSAVGTRITAPLIGWPAIAAGATGIGLAMVAYLATGPAIDRSIARSATPNTSAPTAGPKPPSPPPP